jgi:hypothetical protein
VREAVCVFVSLPRDQVLAASYALAVASEPLSTSSTWRIWNGYNEWDSSKRDLDKEKGSPDMVDQKHSRKYSEEFKRQIVQLHDKG